MNRMIIENADIIRVSAKERLIIYWDSGGLCPDHPL